MKDDIRVKRICLWIAVIGFLLLFALLFVQSFFDSSIKNDWLNSTINFFIWTLAGVSASSITIWLTRIFDYNSKRLDLYIDFYFVALKLKSIFGNFDPFFTALNNSRVIDNYLIFDDNSYLLDELKHIYNKIHFGKKDKEEDILIKNIYNFFSEERMEAVVFIIGCIKTDPTLTGLISSIKSKEPLLFEKVDNPDGIRVDYLSISEKELYFELKSLKDILNIDSFLLKKMPLRASIVKGMDY